MAGQIWSYRVESGVTGDPLASVDLTDYKVEAIDGSVGKVDEATYETGASQLVVDTGPWIFGKKVVIPAGVVDRIDRDQQRIYVNRTKDEIKASPRFGEDLVDETDRDELARYYGPGGPGYREW